MARGQAGALGKSVCLRATTAWRGTAQVKCGFNFDSQRHHRRTRRFIRHRRAQAALRLNREGNK